MIVVGSILTTVEEGQMIDRAEEMGYFAFGEPKTSQQLSKADGRHRRFDHCLSVRERGDAFRRGSRAER